MTKRWQRGTITSILSILLGMAAVASVAVFAQGCNTDQPPKVQVNDAQITTQVKSKLASDVGAETLTNITVNTTNGVVTLAGQVESADVKSHSQTVAEAVPGVVKVNNELQITAASATASH